MSEMRRLAPLVWVQDRDWRILEPDEHKRCRRCGETAVAVLYRPTKGSLPRPWAYCELHIYGRRIIDGMVHVPVCADSISARQGYVLTLNRKYGVDA